MDDYYLKCALHDIYTTIGHQNTLEPVNEGAIFELDSLGYQSEMLSHDPWMLVSYPVISDLLGLAVSVGMTSSRA